MKRISKEIFLKEGLKVLTEIGEAGLTINVITKRLGVTKGSFYHHFKNRQDFSDALISYWEEKSTLEVIKRCEEGENPVEKTMLLKKLATELQNNDLEVAIRAWAVRDPRIKAFQDRIDIKRFEYLKGLAEQITCDKKIAKILTQIFSAVHIAAPQMMPKINEKELEELFVAIGRLSAIL